MQVCVYMQVCKYASMKECRCARIKVRMYNVYASMQVCKYARMQVCMYVQVCKNVGMKECWFANMQVCKYGGFREISRVFQECFTGDSGKF